LFSLTYTNDIIEYMEYAVYIISNQQKVSNEIYFHPHTRTPNNGLDSRTTKGVDDVSPLRPDFIQRPERSSEVGSLNDRRFQINQPWA
jgi:hypothetical protein